MLGLGCRGEFSSMAGHCCGGSVSLGHVARQRVGLAEEAAAVGMLEVEDRVERPVEVMGEPGRLREAAPRETAASFPQAPVLYLREVDLERLRAVRAGDRPHRLAVRVDALVQALQVVEVRRVQLLHQLGRDLGRRPRSG